MKPPITYLGGKLSIADQIVDLLPPHEHYVEPFAGSLAVLLAKPPSRVETVNDLDGDLMNFWRVMRDEPDELERLCALTPHSRAEREAAQPDRMRAAVVSDLERARLVWVNLTQGRGGQLGQRSGWRHKQDPRGRGPMSDYLATYVSRLPPAARRLLAVSLENRPALQVIAEYGSHDACLIYADPPYLDSSRAHRAHGNAYAHEMRDEVEHRELAKELRAARSAVVLSGYDSPLYDELYDGWCRADLSARTGNGLDQRRTEVVWSNRPFPQADLFSGGSMSGGVA